MPLLATDATEPTDLRGALVGGLINESVMQTITDISRIPLPLTNMIGSGSHGNNYHSWTIDKQAQPSTTNAQIDGRISVDNDAAIGDRVGNFSQISTKDISVSTRADASDTIGFQKATAYQTRMRNEDLHRDVEAQICSNTPSVAGTSAVASQSAGLQAWLTSNVSNSSGGGFNTGTGVVDATVPGAATALTETAVRDVAQSVYEKGGNPTMALCVPSVCRAFSEYLFTSSARIATLTAETNQTGPATGVGSVNIFVTDFGVTLDLVPSRIMQNTDTNESTMFLIDPSKLEISYLSGYRSERLAKKGLSEEWLMSVDYTLVVNTEEAHGMIAGIDNTAAVTA